MQPGPFLHFKCGIPEDISSVSVKSHLPRKLKMIFTLFNSWLNIRYFKYFWHCGAEKSAPSFSWETLQENCTTDNKHQASLRFRQHLQHYFSRKNKWIIYSSILTRISFTPLTLTRWASSGHFIDPGIQGWAGPCLGWLLKR